MLRIFFPLILILSLTFSQNFLAPIAICPIADDNGAVIQFVMSGEYADTIMNSDGEFVRYFIPTGGYVGDVGKPRIPIWSTLIAIPPHSGVSAVLVKAEWDTVENVLLYPVQDPIDEQEFVFDRAAYENGIYPNKDVSVGEPAIMRDFRVAPVDFYPFRYDAKSKTLLIARKMTVRISFVGIDNKNTLDSEPTHISEAFDALYRSAIANYWFYRRNLSLRRGTILYIVRDDYEEDFEQLIRWRQMAGYRVRVVRAYEDIGGGDRPTPDEIDDYIQNAYDTWEFPPDYVVFGGDCAMSGTYLDDYGYHSAFTGLDYTSDHEYALTAGDDYLADIMVGRIAVDYSTEAQTYSAKVVGYETNPLQAGSDWLTRGIEVAANCCGTPEPQTPRLVTLWQRQLAMQNGYTDIETVYCYGSYCPRGASTISAFVNEGASFVNYRGWAGPAGWVYPGYYVSDVQGLSNHWKLPVVTSIVCGTGDFDGSTDPCFGEAWIRVGTPTNPTGAVDFYGPSDHNTHTKWNNPNSEGVWWGFFQENLSSFGQCVLRAKLTLYLAYPDDRPIGMGVDHYQYIYNIIGDPSVTLWRAVPESISVIHPAEIHSGDTRIVITASSGGAPLENAVASVWFSDGDPYTAFLDETGAAVISFPDSETIGKDSLSLVVKIPGYIPYIATIPITSAENSVSLSACESDDDASGESDGNDDGIPAAGEQIELRLTLHNLGDATLSAVRAKIVPDDNFTIIDTFSDFGDIGAGASVPSSDPIAVAINSDIDDSTEIFFQFAISYSGGTLDTASYHTYLRAPKLTIVSVTPADDGILSPDETTTLNIVLRNDGSVPMQNASVSITSGDWVSAHTTSASLTSLAPGETASLSPEIEVFCDSTMIDGIIDSLAIAIDDGYYADEINCPVPVGEISSNIFGGPDQYGYYCYDNSDTASGWAPEYDWIEISPDYGGTGTNLNLGDDETAVIPLPFAFVYYGETYYSIGICSNGWIAMGDVSDFLFWNFYNRPLPDPSGPPAMICPFWDDINPDFSNCGVYYKYISADHIFVVEWRTIHTFDNATVEWFELILRHPTIYGTPTGDGEIVFQYNEIADIDSQINPDDIAEYSTVGIEEPEQRFGIQYSYCKILAPYAAPLANERAILFTTKAPEPIFENVSEPNAKLPDKVDLKISPNPFNPILSISIVLPKSENISLEIFDVSGKLVRTLSRGKYFAGSYRFFWDGSDDSGIFMPSGIYFVKFAGDNETISRKALLLK